MNINTHYTELSANYLFRDIELRVAHFMAHHPSEHLLRMGVGDVTLPLSRAVVEAVKQAAEELGNQETFRGYGPENGYEWLRRDIIDCYFHPYGVDFQPDEIFISEGAGSDLGNLSELFDSNNKVAILNPTYPAYVDASVMAGREVQFLPCTEENGFVPDVPLTAVDIIYLCFPNNPTGVVITYDQLQEWVEYARRNHSIIIFDAAYEAYVFRTDVPHSIYEIAGAKEVAIEVHSFSKNAGFTSVRCGYTVVPYETGLQAMWMRRQCTKYNGTSYIAQRAAQATFTPQAQKDMRTNIAYYLQTADIIRNGLRRMGYDVYGGENAPYVWCKVPYGWDSWNFFDLLLNRCHVVATPGVGFGKWGEGYIRFSAFSKREECVEALNCMKENI